MSREILAVIPARGGSKSIPRKNLLPVGGMPLVERSIRAAKNAVGVTRVVVSTDDREIASVARSVGAEVRDRPAEISGDDASSESALLDVLEHLAATEGYRPDLLLFLQCTSPLTCSRDIESAIETFESSHADSLLSVCVFGGFVWKQDADGSMRGVNHSEKMRLRRQERTPEFVENGAIYLMNTAGFLNHKHRFFGKIASVIMHPGTMLELDEPEDVELLEALMRNPAVLHQGKNA